MRRRNSSFSSSSSNNNRKLRVWGEGNCAAAPPVEKRSYRTFISFLLWDMVDWMGRKWKEGKTTYISIYTYIEWEKRNARHVGYKMKFSLLDAHPREHKIEVHRGGWMGLRERRELRRGMLRSGGSTTILAKETTPTRTTSTRTTHKSSWRQKG